MMTAPGAHNDPRGASHLRLSESPWPPPASRPFINRPEHGNPLDPYLPYGELRKDLFAFLAERVASLSGRARGLSWVSRDAGGNLVLCLISPSEFESACLGPPIGRLEHLVIWGEGGLELARTTLRRAVDGARQHGLHLLLAKTSGRVSGVRGVLVRTGFRQLAEKQVYLCPGANRRAVKPLQPRHRVRTATPADLAALIPLAERFEYSQYLDLPGVSPARVSRLYRAWMRRAWQGEFADRVLVAEARGRPCGFFAYKTDGVIQDLTGLRIARSTLTAVDPATPSAFAALIREFNEIGRAGKLDGAEIAFYPQNSPVRRMLERFCCHPGRSEFIYCCDTAQASAPA